MKKKKLPLDQPVDLTDAEKLRNEKIALLMKPILEGIGKTQRLVGWINDPEAPVVIPPEFAPAPPESDKVRDPADFLRGWGEIASFLKVSDRQAQDWEKEKKLPIRRIDGIPQALKTELSAWWEKNAKF